MKEVYRVCIDMRGLLLFTVYILLLLWKSNQDCVVPENGRSLEIPRGRGVLKANILEAKYEAKLEFPGGTGGAKQKTWSEIPFIPGY